MRCTVCASTNIVLNDLGFQICTDCGTQSQDYAEEFGDFDFDTGPSFVRRTIAVDETQTEATVVVYGVDSELVTVKDPMAMIAGLQSLLFQQADSLIRICGCNERLIDAVGCIWQRYLRIMAVSGNWFGVQIFSEESFSDSETMSSHRTANATEGEGGLKQKQIASFPKPTSIVPHICLAILYIASIWTREGITAMDLVRWVTNYTLPYLNGSRQSELEVNLSNTKIQSARIMSHNLPSVNAIRKASKALIGLLGLDKFNMTPNVPLIAVRVGSLLNLPDTLGIYTLNLSQFCIDKLNKANNAKNVSQPHHFSNFGMLCRQNLHYENTIAALMIITWKLSAGLLPTYSQPPLTGWMDFSEWMQLNNNIVHNLLYCSEVPWTHGEMTALPTGRMDAYLSRIERLVKSDGKGESEFRSIIHEYANTFRNLSRDIEEEEEGEYIPTISVSKKNKNSKSKNNNIHRLYSLYSRTDWSRDIGKYHAIMITIVSHAFGLRAKIVENEVSRLEWLCFGS